MRHRSLSVGLLLALVVSGCVASSTLEGYRAKNQDEALVVLMLLKIPNGIKARSVEMILQPYAEDVYVGNFQKYLGVASPTAPLSISKRDLRGVYAEVFRGAKDVSMDVKNFRISMTGDRAVAEARTELIYKIEAGRHEAKQQIFLNDVTWRMRRTPAGWKIVEEIWQ
ncbi:MAG: nuclear transport factor 2 family protein [candidate division NC10 bacterium]|nr:nuclear transport factor 2 family protein [candidate division NC10 bacterium]